METSVKIAFVLVGIGLIVVAILPFLYSMESREAEFRLIEDMIVLDAKYWEVIPDCYNGNLPKCNYADQLSQQIITKQIQWEKLVSSRP
ncbi:MAG: hypothetical protein OXC46_04360 [Thaumarchaeota archaeon]|nr:hypothetical protein [Nitrososphaerota archaeon]